MGLEKAFHLKEINSLSALQDLVLKTPEIVWAMMVGGMVIGLPLAVIGYYITFSITSRYREKIKAKIARSKEKRAQKKALRRAKAAGEIGHVSPAGNPAAQNPTGTGADESVPSADL
jgi:hypothetical protein